MVKSYYTKKEITAGLLLLLANILFMLAIWLERNYDQISFDQFLFQFKSTSTGVNSDLLHSAVLQVGFLSLSLTALEGWVYWMFSYAREELTRLAEGDAPFNFTMLTADTHFPDGCRCSLCREEYDVPYANVLACSSRQVAEFVAWIQEQSFYENTTVVISGDHLTMDAGFMDEIAPDYTRSVYNCFIHAAAAPVKEKNRLFGTFDLFPTTLAALGVEIEGDRLALGTNLFSDRETLTEQFGWEYLTEELQKQSAFYDAELLRIEG